MLCIFVRFSDHPSWRGWYISRRLPGAKVRIEMRGNHQVVPHFHGDLTHPLIRIFCTVSKHEICRDFSGLSEQ